VRALIGQMESGPNATRASSSGFKRRRGGENKGKLLGLDVVCLTYERYDVVCQTYAIVSQLRISAYDVVRHAVGHRYVTYDVVSGKKPDAARHMIWNQRLSKHMPVK
jgi:hypothetical protein